MNYKLPAREVTASLIMDVVERCCHDGANIDSLVQYTNKSKPYVVSAIDAGCLLKMLDVQENKTWRTSKDCAEILTNTLSKQTKLVVFKKWLFAWTPFILFLQYIQIGDDINTAARKIASRFSFNKKKEDISKLLFTWAKNCKIMNAKQELLIPNSSQKYQEILGGIEQDVIDASQARMYLAQELGAEIFSWLKPDEIQELENGLMKIQEAPRESAHSLGIALEDVLKRIYVDLLGFDAQDLTKKNTISQVAECLRSKEYIHAKQHHLVLAQGHIRNMASHGKEVESMEKWELTSMGAKGQLFFTLALIKSLFRYAKYQEHLY